MRRFFKSLFGASTKEVNGIIVLVVVFMLSLSYPTIHRLFLDDMSPLSEGDTQKLDSLVTLLSTSSATVQVQKEIFDFNPNKVTKKELVRLGFTQRAASQLVNYRSKGGVFRIKNDLYRIYAIDSALVSSLYAYIDLPESIKTPTTSHRKALKPEKVKGIRHTELKPPTKPKKFDLNQADTAMLQTVYGIGSVLSKRIVSFREKLGGIVNEKQLYEVYNLDSAVIDSLLQVAFITQSSEIKKIAINAFPEEELAAHPYISWKQARLIVAYRNQHGAFRAEADLRKVYLVGEEDIKRLAPYLQFD